MSEPVDDGGEHPVAPWLTPRRRAWCYRVATAASPLLVILGVTTDEVVATISGIVVAVLGTGMAAAHTPTTK